MSRRSDLAELLGGFSTLLEARIPLRRTLTILEKQTSRPGLKRLCAELRVDLENGRSVSEGLERQERWIAPEQRALIAAGESRGRLDLAMSELARELERELRLRRRTLNALLYPMLIGMTALVCMIWLVAFLAPELKSLLDISYCGEPMFSLPTMLVLGVGGLIGDHSPLLLGSASTGLAVLHFVRRWDGPRRLLGRGVDALPVVGTLRRRYDDARVSRTMAQLLEAGAPLLEVLELAGTISTRTPTKEAMARVSRDVRAGESLARSLASTGEFDQLLVQLVDIGEETGELAKGLRIVSDRYEDDAAVIVETLGVALEPIMVLMVGAAVGLVCLATLEPISALVKAL